MQRHCAHLQLPTVEQPLQRLEPNACRGADMELTPTRWQRLRQVIYRLFEVRAGRLLP